MFVEVREFARMVTDPEFLASVIMAVALLVTAITVAQPLWKTDQLAARMRGVATDRESMRRKNRATIASEQAEKTHLDNAPRVLGSPLSTS